MEQFHEDIIIGFQGTGKKVLFWIMNVVWVILAFISAIFLQGIAQASGISWISVLVCLVFAALAFLVFWARQFLKVDYEYSLTNSQMEVDRVTNNKYRTKIMDFNVSEVEIIAPTDSDHFRRYRAMPGIKVLNATVSKNNPGYFVVFQKRNQRYLLTMELSEKMRELMKYHAGTAAKY